MVRSGVIALWVRGIIIYDLLLLLIAYLISVELAFLVVMPVLLVVSLVDAGRSIRRVEYALGFNLIKLLVVVLFISFGARAINIYFFDSPLEKTLIFYLSITLILLYLNTDMKSFILRDAMRDILAGLLIFIIMIFSTFGAFYMMSLLTGSVLIFNWVAFLIVLPAMITVGFGEEALFRGLLQRVLIDKLGFRAGIFLASFFMFSLWHVLWIFDMGLSVRFVFYVLFTGILGLLIGLAYEGSKSLLPVVIAHALWDAYQSGIEEFYINVTYINILLSFIVSILIYILSLLYLRRLIDSIYSY